MMKMVFHILDLPTPKKISWFWLAGSMLGRILIFQIISGYFISCFYTKDQFSAFRRVDRIKRDINFGSFIRHLHIFGARIFFFIMYIHMRRGIYYLSFLKKILAWIRGVTIYLLLIVTSFVGYVLPWAQMSFWAATVITNFITVIPIFGVDIVQWVWGRFSVDYTTLMRFYTLHFLLPSILAIISIIHILVLHERGSSSPLGVVKDYQRFRSFCLVKDSLGILRVLGVFLILYYKRFMIVSDSEQYLEAKPFITPVHIVPEWYFLPAYAILRSVPKKLGGVVLLLGYILILYIYPFMIKTKFQLKKMKIFSVMLFWFFIFKFFLLIYLGGSVAEQPFILFSQICSFLYFVYFFIIGLIKF